MERFTRLETLATAYLLNHNGPINADELSYMLKGLTEYAASVFDGQIDRIAPGLESLILLRDTRWAAVIATAINAHGAQTVCNHIWDELREPVEA